MSMLMDSVPVQTREPMEPEPASAQPGDGEPAGALVVYADFGCPMCYLASQRVDELARAGVGVDWHAVEHRARTPATGSSRASDARSAVERALAGARALRRTKERLPASAPVALSRTQAPVSAYAEGCVAQVGEVVRRRLFEAYWADGVDIGTPATVRSLLGVTFMRSRATSDPVRDWGFAVDVTGAPMTTRAWRLTRDWERAWQELGRPELPALWDGTRLVSGADALRRLAEEVEGAPAPGAERNGVDPGTRQVPGWRRAVAVRPPATWVSQVGDPWARSLRMSP